MFFQVYIRCGGDGALSLKNMATDQQRLMFNRRASVSATIPPPKFPVVPDFIRNRSPKHAQAYEEWEGEVEKWRRNIPGNSQTPRSTPN